MCYFSFNFITLLIYVTVPSIGVSIHFSIGVKFSNSLHEPQKNHQISLLVGMIITYRNIQFQHSFMLRKEHKGTSGSKEVSTDLSALSKHDPLVKSDKKGQWLQIKFGYYLVPPRAT
jgi:hypothetical protein